MGNGRFLIAGGLSYSQIFTFKNPNILRSCEIYDATGNRMDTARSMATTRALMSSFLLPNGRVLIAGGMTGNIQNGGVATDLCQFYDPATNSWSTAPFLPNKAAGAASVPLKDGRFGLIGGGSNTLYFPYANNQSSAYNYTTGKWDPLPLMQVGRLGPVVMELQSCGMAVFGGGATNSATSVDTHELLIK